MGTRQARRQRQIERVHERYAGVLLAVGMPRRAAGPSHDDVRFKEGECLWYDHEWRTAVRDFYIAAHQGSPAPSDKTVKQFVRGYVRWVRNETYKRKYV